MHSWKLNPTKTGNHYKKKTRYSPIRESKKEIRANNI